MATTADSNLLEAVHALPPDGQQSVLKYALFLRQEAEQSRLHEDETKWNEQFADEQKMANFSQWTETSLRENPPEPFDLSQL